jgi:hypothetical protein
MEGRLRWRWGTTEWVTRHLARFVSRSIPSFAPSSALTSFQQRLFKTDGSLIRHAQYFILQLAEGKLTQRRFAQIIRRIERLAWRPM